MNYLFSSGHLWQIFLCFNVGNLYLPQATETFASVECVRDVWNYWLPSSPVSNQSITSLDIFMKVSATNKPKYHVFGHIHEGQWH